MNICSYDPSKTLPHPSENKVSPENNTLSVSEKRYDQGYDLDMNYLKLSFSKNKIIVIPLLISAPEPYFDHKLNKQLLHYILFSIVNFHQRDQNDGVCLV